MDKRHMDKFEAIQDFRTWIDKFYVGDYEFDIQTSNRNQTITITANRFNKFPVMEK